MCTRPRCIDPECREALLDAEVPYRLEVEPPKERPREGFGYARRLRCWRASLPVLAALRRGLPRSQAAREGGVSLTAASKYVRILREEARP